MAVSGGDKKNGKDNSELVDAFYAWRADNLDALELGGHGNLADLLDMLREASK